MAGGKSSDSLLQESWQDTDLESTETDIMRECFSLSLATNLANFQCLLTCIASRTAVCIAFFAPQYLQLITRTIAYVMPNDDVTTPQEH